MSDLTGKFGSFEEQIASNHTEIMNALDTIATALGAPPPGPTTTLADVVTALTQTNIILAGIRTDMNGYLMEIFNTLDTMNNNASLNAQRIISTLLQTACPCDDTVPLLPPELGTTPTTADNQTKCQRIQYFLDLYRSWVITVGQYVGNQGSISSFQLNNLLQVTLGNVDITTGQLKAGIPISVRDTVVAQLTSVVGAAGAAAVDSGLFNALVPGNLEALRQALYGATTAEGGKAAAEGAINDLGLSIWVTAILKTMFYSAWPNDMYSDVPVVDASAYDGSICAPITECYTFDSSNVTMTTGPNTVHFQGIIWPNDAIFPAISETGGTVGSAPIWSTMDLYGWRIHCTIGSTTVYLNTSGAHSLGGDQWTCDVHTTLMSMVTGEGNEFSVEMCIPLV